MNSCTQLSPVFGASTHSKGHYHCRDEASMLQHRRHKNVITMMNIKPATGAVYNFWGCITRGDIIGCCATTLETQLVWMQSEGKPLISFGYQSGLLSLCLSPPKQARRVLPRGCTTPMYGCCVCCLDWYVEANWLQLWVDLVESTLVIVGGVPVECHGRGKGQRLQSGVPLTGVPG